MKSFREDQLVTVDRDGVVLDGVVSHVANILKVVVAIPDEERGAILRTVHPRTLTERDEPGENDQTLRRLISRSPASLRGGPRGGNAGSGRRGHSRTASHRTTGK